MNVKLLWSRIRKGLIAALVSATILATLATFAAFKYKKYAPNMIQKKVNEEAIRHLPDEIKKEVIKNVQPGMIGSFLVNTFSSEDVDTKMNRVIKTVDEWLKQQIQHGKIEVRIKTSPDSLLEAHDVTKYTFWVVYDGDPAIVLTIGEGGKPNAEPRESALLFRRLEEVVKGAWSGEK